MFINKNLVENSFKNYKKKGKKNFDFTQTLDTPSNGHFPTCRKPFSKTASIVKPGASCLMGTDIIIERIHPTLGFTQITLTLDPPGITNPGNYMISFLVPISPFDRPNLYGVSSILISEDFIGSRLIVVIPNCNLVGTT